MPFFLPFFLFFLGPEARVRILLNKSTGSLFVTFIYMDFKPAAIKRILETILSIQLHFKNDKYKKQQSSKTNLLHKSVVRVDSFLFSQYLCTSITTLIISQLPCENQSVKADATDLPLSGFC